MPGHCCSAFTTDWLQVFPDRFIPFPTVYDFGPTGLKALEPSKYFENTRKFSFSPLQQRLICKNYPSEASQYVVPFHLYCPSMKEKIENGICPVCDQYWPSAAAMLRHRKCHRRNNNEVQFDDAESNEGENHRS